jgi:hypothetical protein
MAFPATSGGEAFAYRSPDAVSQALGTIATQSQGPARVQTLCQTPGGRELSLLVIGDDKKAKPAVMVVANMEGNCPIATEAALKLGELLGTEWKEERDAYTWYILALGNPDGHARFFVKPLNESFVNDRSINDDNDDGTDEDGPDDLNGDGFITMMRQAHPEGSWMAVNGNPVLMKKADNAKGEDGVWRLFSEGIDNDGDGEINEDGPGGTNPGHNFPHGFEHYVPANGPWAASEIECRSILEFTFAHPEIAMVVTFGRTNTLKSVPESNRKAAAGGGKYKVPERWANRFGLDADEEYPIKDLLELARDAFSYPSLTEDQLLQWLGVGAALNPNKNDLGYWKEISKRYNDFIKEAEADGERLDPPGFSDGSIEEWAYYQYGVPSFSLDFWTVPKQKKEEKKSEDSTLTVDDVEKMSNDDFIALGAEKIDAFLKENKAPSHFTAEMLIERLKGGQMTTKRVAEFIRKSQEKDEEGGADEAEQALYDFDSTAFVPWKSYNHPTLGKVEIGGQIAYRDLTPPDGQVDSLVAIPLPFMRQLVKTLPTLTIEETKVENKSTGVWKIEAWIANTGFLPYPTHQGERSERPAPVIVTLSGSGLTFLEGKERRSLGLIDGSGGASKVSWLVQAGAGQQLTVKVDSKSAGTATRTVTLTGGGQ